MKMSIPLRRIASFLTLTVFFANPLFAQRSSSNQTQGKPPAPATGQSPATPVRPQPSTQTRTTATLETLFAADSYKLYGEVRSVGQLVTSPGVVEILEPILKLATPPEELKALIKFLNTNAEPLAGSPMLFAAWPVRSGLPQAIVAIELPSVEEAEKFEPKLKSFLPVIIPAPTPRPTMDPSRAALLRGEKDEAKTPEAVPDAAPSPKPPLASGEHKPAPGDEKEEPAPPFLIKRSGALIIITDSPFTFKNLRPAGSKLLTEDQNFRVARDRFSSEPLFVYYNVALEDESTRRLKEMASADREVITVEERPVPGEPGDPTLKGKKPEGEPDTQPIEPVVVPAPDSPPENPEPELPSPEEPSNAQLVAGEKKPEAKPDSSDPFLNSLFGSFGFGAPEWPDAVGVALAFESDSYIIRVILIDPPTAKITPIPFLPQLISGRAGTPDAPSVLPADTEVFASVSLDLRRMYEALLQNLQKRNPVQAVFARPLPGEEPTISPAETAAMEAVFEKKYGFKIKDELLPALGNEFAVGGSMKSLGLANEFGLSAPPQPTPSPGASGSSQLGSGPGTSAQPPKSSPVILISVKDRDAVKALIPKLLDAMGMKALSLIAQTEKRGDTETVTYAGLISYAFVGNFLVLSPEVAEVRHVVDSYVDHETIGSNSAFRTFTRWQPREVQGLAYVAPSVMAAYNDMARNPKMGLDAPMRDFMARLNPAPAAISYALSNDGFGPMHELHLPKNLVLMMVAGVSAGSNTSPADMNEAVAKSALRTIVAAEETYKATSGNGSYGTMDQLATAGLVSRDLFEKYGYKFEVTVSGTRFEATATPKEYGVTGSPSFFVDESGIVRGADHNGAPANAGDPNVNDASPPAEA
ncbi:MAG: hypothetical protein ABI596_14980 [Pyrinomonadaceae bacterium]